VKIHLQGALALTLCTVTSAFANLIDSEYGAGAGSFEIQNSPFIETHPDFMRLPSGSSVITGWSVGGNGVDYLTEPLHLAVGSGTYSIDLSAETAGTLSTNFSTVIGSKYRLTFQAYGSSSPGIYTGRVSVGDLVGQLFTPANVALPETATFTSYDFQFTALSTNTTLFFDVASSPSGFGPVIDEVSVNIVPLPSAVWFFGSGLLGLIGIARKKTA
jgi:choice-of-anchor C domain-containing protein